MEKLNEYKKPNHALEPGLLRAALAGGN